MKINDRLFSVFLGVTVLPSRIRDGIETFHEQHILKLDPQRILFRGRISFLTDLSERLGEGVVKVTLDSEKQGRLHFVTKARRLQVGDDLIIDAQGKQKIDGVTYDRVKIACRVPAEQMALANF